MKNTKALVSVAVGLGLMGLALSAPANADTNAGSTTALAGVGSDTTQDVVEGLAAGLGGGTAIANYKATPAGRTITTRTGNANCTIGAPNGSGAGLNALSASIGGLAYTNAAGGGNSTNLKNCIDFARSSSGSNPSTPPGGATGQLTYVPFAVDAVTYATLTVSDVPKSLDKADLVFIYSQNTGSCLYQPLVPQSGSGTRDFFLKTYLGFSSSTIGATGGPGTCVKDVNASSTNIQEHDGRFLTNSQQLIPFSVAQYIAQASGVIPDLRGRASLGTINEGTAGAQGKSSLNLNTAFPANRPVYNVIPTQVVGQTGTVDGFNATLINQTLITDICGADGQAIVNKYGFGSIPASGYSTTCGSTSKKNTN